MKHIIRIIKGFFIGVATLVPGASGGTMAIILGIYDDIIAGISEFFKNWKKNFILLAEVAVGGLLGILILSYLFEGIIDKYEFEMKYLFMGAIIGGLPTLIKKAKETQKIKPTNYIYLVIGFVLTLVMVLEPDAIVNLTASKDLLGYLFLFIAGFIIAVALVLPGISGSFMLLALGLYDKTLNAINNRVVEFLIPLALGIIVGTLLSSKVIDKCLHKYPTSTYMLIIGFVLGSIVILFPGLPSKIEWVTAPLMLIIGFLPMYILGRKNLID
jgi:putative membrane protein